jgi:hypothetical protein
MFTRPVSVDLGMVVNQLNVTGPYSSLVWQSVILENAAPGERSSSLQQQSGERYSLQDMQQQGFFAGQAQGMSSRGASQLALQARFVRRDGELPIYTLRSSGGTTVKPVAQMSCIHALCNCR